MLAAFCLRLALGMVAFLPLLPADKMHPRFFRTQFLVALGLWTLATGLLWHNTNLKTASLLICCICLHIYGAITWTLDQSPFSRCIWFLTLLASGFGATFGFALAYPGVFEPWWIVDSLGSGLLLGAAVTSMLVGHSYLISPGLTIQPLVTMIGCLAFFLAFRIVCNGWAWITYVRTETASEFFHTYWHLLFPRWLIGLGGPLVFGFMAYLTARIRSTQSATGILFVVVICTFLGELMSLVLTRMAGWPL